MNMTFRNIFDEKLNGNAKNISYDQNSYKIDRIKKLSKEFLIRKKVKVHNIFIRYSKVIFFIVSFIIS